MSELINNAAERKAKLKKLSLKLHSGETEDAVRKELLETLSQIPYGEVVEVEQELISEGLPESEVLKLCDAHSAGCVMSISITREKNTCYSRILKNRGLQDLPRLCGASMMR